eukprot:TRINITY_DN2061_c0_g2_i1.p1 TRINITY_DN2061_c0_g2~~TRINITY_DN2061_c0_g2_i1.p1  ORF type:complete len:345 (-),score=14.11 TRINITY_DN2061_c0_g2_i1:187-1221(-)
MDKNIKHVLSPALPWKIKIHLALLFGAVGLSRRSNGTVRRCLFNFFDVKVAATNGKPVGGVKTTDLTVDPTKNVWFRLFTPTEIGNDVSLPVIVFFHGGGFAFLSPASKVYDAFCRRIAREIPAYVVSVNYRLSPENRFPAPYDDGFNVLRWLDDRKNSANFPQNADLSRCFLAGDSAGGNLTHHIGRRVAETSEPIFRELRVIGLIAIQPFFGGVERTPAELRFARGPVLSMELTDWFWKAFLPEGSDRDHEAANVTGPKSVDISGLDLPATLVFVGGFDLLQDRQRRYYEGLKGLGKEAYLVEYPNAIHFCYVFPELPESSMLITEVRDFIEKQSDKLETSM